MRRWNRSSENGPRPSFATVRPPVRGPLLLALVLTLGAGCVTRGTYREATDERDSLGAAKTRLERDLKLARASNESLSTERTKLIGEVEDLRQARAELTDNVARLESERARLSSDLERRRAEVEASREEVDSLRSTYDGLVDDLQREVSQGRVQIERLREGLQVHLAQEVLFPVGSAQLDPEGRRILRKVAERLAGLPQKIAVHGHTDDRPILGALASVYPSNWELAGARASSVVRLLEEAGVDAERLEAVSFGASKPRATNETAEGRAYNRRIELQLAPAADAEVPPELVAPAAPSDPIPPEAEPPPLAPSPLPAEARGDDSRAEAPAAPLGPPKRGEKPPAPMGPPKRGEKPPVPVPDEAAGASAP